GGEPPGGRPCDRRMGRLVPGASGGLAVHEERMLLPEPGPGHLDALVVGLVQVLVVGRHRRGGGAEPSLCPGVPPVRGKRGVTWSILGLNRSRRSPFPPSRWLRGTARSIPRFGT